ESVLSSLTVDDLSTITSLTIPNTVSSLTGLEYAEHLEILSFEPGNTLISDLSPIASLASLYVLELDSLENMDVSLLSTLTDAVGALKMDLESDTSRWNGTSESYCVGLCSLRSLEISGSDDSIGSDLSSFTSLLNNIAMCSGQCVSSDDDGTKVYPLSSTLTHLDLSSNAISDPTIVSLQPGLSGVTHLTLSDNSISDLVLLQQAIDDSNSTIAYVDVSDNRLDCGSSVSECLNALADICERDISGSGDGNDGVEVVFGDVDGSSGDVSQDTTSPCGSKPISISSIFCSYSQDHLVCQVNDSADDDGSEYVCVCGSGYYEDTSSGECVSAATVVSSSSSSSACSNCGGERGTCVYDADSDSNRLVCQVNDSADDDGSEYVCVCGSGYYEDTSSGECVSAATVVSSSSSSSACSNCGGERGTCVYDADSDSSDESLPFCECSDGWYGTDCSSICPVSDDLGLCSGSSRGTCDAATHICVCESGYYGSSCDLYCDSLSRCGLHGRCSVGDLSSSSSSETLYCECDAGWNGSTCFTQYPVETVEYVNDDDETNPTIVDYVCGINYSTDPSSSYSDYAIYSSDTDTYSCDCSSYGLITDASTSTCIDPATHPEYKDIAGNDTACLTCGTTTDSHGTCVLGEGEDSLIAMCQCEYGWGNDVDGESSCSENICGTVGEDECSSHGSCIYDSFESSCLCDDGWGGVSCNIKENTLKILMWVCISVAIVSLISCIIGFILWYHEYRLVPVTQTPKDENNIHELDSRVQSSDIQQITDISPKSEHIEDFEPQIHDRKQISSDNDLQLPIKSHKIVDVRDIPSLDSDFLDDSKISTVTIKRKVKKSSKSTHSKKSKKDIHSPRAKSKHKKVKLSSHVQPLHISSEDTHSPSTKKHKRKSNAKQTRKKESKGI
ncbi:hypothetical protein ADUPG1_000533, partial [Aduncisulcus paluster]